MRRGACVGSSSKTTWLIFIVMLPLHLLEIYFLLFYSEKIEMVSYKNPVPGLDPTIAANLAAYGSPWGGAQRQVNKRGKEIIFYSQ